MEDDESKLFELNMALPLFKMISIDEGIKNVETETDIGTYGASLMPDFFFKPVSRSFDWTEAVNF